MSAGSSVDGAVAGSSGVNWKTGYTYVLGSVGDNDLVETLGRIMGLRTEVACSMYAEGLSRGEGP